MMRIPLRRLAPIVGAATLVVVLGGAAYVAGDLVRAPRKGAGLPGGPTFIGITQARELPTTEADARGVVLRHMDNSLFIGTNVLKWQRIRDDDASPARHEIAYDGPVVEREVVVTHDTVIYKDVTSFDQARVIDGKVQQQVTTGMLDDIRADAMLRVWGERKGDRVVARVIVYAFLPA